MSPLRILLADDHTITREGMRRLLAVEPELAVVGEAADGEETVHLATTLHPDILLLDVSMPRLDGIQVAQRLTKALPELKIIVLTGYDQEQYARTLLGLGVHAFLSKAASSREVVHAIRAVHAGQHYVLPAVAELLAAGIGGPLREHLTPRELEVLRLVAEGCGNRTIAQYLKMSARTVQFHLHNLFSKLHATSRTELVHLARQQGWLV